MKCLNYWKNKINRFCRLARNFSPSSFINSVLTNIKESFKKKKESTTNPLFSCIAIRTNQIVQCYNNELKFHNHIRYAYFDLDSILRTAWNRKDSILIRIICNRGKNNGHEIIRFKIDLEKVITKDTIIGDINNKEILVKGERGHLLIRIPDTCEGGSKIVFIYNRNDIN